MAFSHVIGRRCYRTTTATAPQSLRPFSIPTCSWTFFICFILLFYLVFVLNRLRSDTPSRAHSPPNAFCAIVKNEIFLVVHHLYTRCKLLISHHRQLQHVCVSALAYTRCSIEITNKTEKTMMIWLACILGLFPDAVATEVDRSPQVALE